MRGKAALTWLSIFAGCGPSLQLASVGDLPLERGGVLRDCRVGYRTFGRLDATRSNAVLVLPWSMGTSRDLAWQMGSGKLVDDTRFFVIAVDALANGVSSSPSSGGPQGGKAFPAIAIGDMVESQYRLLTRVLGLQHLHAIVGISMGGMQTFEWMSTHPGFFDRAVPIAGSPRSTRPERAQWEGYTKDVEAERGWKGAAQALGRGQLRTALQHLRIDADDYARQAEAIIGLDATRRSGGSIEGLANTVHAKVLVVVSQRDEVVDPAPALEFARLAGASVLQLDGRCGHAATSCERETLFPAVRRFLEE